MHTSIKSAKIAFYIWSIIVTFLAFTMFFIGFTLSVDGNLTSFGYLLVCFSGITIVTIFFGILGVVLDNVWVTVHTASVFVIMITMEVISLALLWISRAINSKKFGPNEKFLKYKCANDIKSLACNYVPVVSAVHIVTIATQIILIYNAWIIVNRLLETRT